MDIVSRAKNICLTPNTEWNVIAEENTPTASLFTEYVVPLAAIGAIAGLIGHSVVGVTVPFGGTIRIGLVAGLVGAVFGFVMAIVTVFVISLIVDALAPTFGGQKSSSQAMKVAVYSFTPAWLAGVLQIIPMLGVLGILAGLYGIYLLYLGLPKLMKCAQDKAVGYTVVVVVCAIVLGVCIGAVTSMIGFGAMYSTGAFSSMTIPSGTTASSDIKVDPNSALGKLQALGQKMEESGKKMEAAQKSGDANATAAAAAETLGALLGGGKRVDPIGIDELKPFVPETFAGLKRTSSNAEKTGMAGIMVSKAEATYEDQGANKRVRLEVTDTGGVSGMLGFASWMGVQGEKENEIMSERTQKVNGRLVHERMSKNGGDNQFGLVLGDRFVVEASGNVDLNQLKSAVSSIDLAKLESMKGSGVK